MTTAAFNYTTGPTVLPDVGIVRYNGCTFGPLFTSNVSGNPVKDDARRVTKLVEYTIEIDGYVTPPASGTIAPTMEVLKRLLTAQGAALDYQGRGFDLSINGAGGVSESNDVAWGPVPELLEFQPLGGGLSAKVKWKVKVHLIRGTPKLSSIFGGIVLQFNYDTVLTYGEDGYSSLAVHGVLEVPLRREPADARSPKYTVDIIRSSLDRTIFLGIDMSRFRVVRREYPVSRDKRTMQFSVEVQERPYMDPPPHCMVARGTFSVRPARTGMGLVLWLCTLRGTYTVRNDAPRRMAWLAFLAMLRERMSASALGIDPKVVDPGDRKGKIPVDLKILAGLGPFLGPIVIGNRYFLKLLSDKGKKDAAVNARKALLIDFSFEEGLYNDSKTTSFSATWRITTSISHILLASGLWKKLPDRLPIIPAFGDASGGNIWALSVRDITGSQSWLPNKLDPNLDIIVDFGGP